jgi:5-(carboxyamino)imidazole ribonucleotide synthase
VLTLIADKLEQKNFFREGGLPVAEPLPIDPDTPNTERTPVIQKTRFGGYDGRGVARVLPGEQFPLQGPTFVEEAIPIEREVAVLVAVARDGQTTTWDPMEMVFEPRLNLVSHVVSPAELSSATAEAAREIAVAAAVLLEPIGFCGVLAVELFLQPNGTLILNEVAPRPHNSGHLTIEASRCSQFEQHLRCVAGFPLGTTERLTTAAMVNLLGPDGLTGTYRTAGVDEALGVTDAHIHLYGKQLARPGRKMGHVTARGPDRRRAIHAAHEAAAAIRFEPID